MSYEEITNPDYNIILNVFCTVRSVREFRKKEFIKSMDWNNLHGFKMVPEFKETSNALGGILVHIDQKPVNPWTFQCGFMVGISDKVEIMIELGSNFNDIAISVLTVSYRF